MFYLRYRQDIFRLTIEYPTISSQSQNPEKIGWVHRYHRGRFRGNLEEGAMLQAIHDSIHIFIFAQLLFGLYISGGSCRKQLVDRLAAQVRQVPAPSVLVRCRPQTMTGSRTRSAGTGC